MSVMHDKLKVIKSPKYRDKPVAEIRTDLSFPDSMLHWLYRSAASFLTGTLRTEVVLQ